MITCELTWESKSDAGGVHVIGIVLQRSQIDGRAEPSWQVFWLYSDLSKRQLKYGGFQKAKKNEEGYENLMAIDKGQTSARSNKTQPGKTRFFTITAIKALTQTPNSEFTGFSFKDEKFKDKENMNAVPNLFIAQVYQLASQDYKGLNNINSESKHLTGLFVFLSLSTVTSCYLLTTVPSMTTYLISSVCGQKLLENTGKKRESLHRIYTVKGYAVMRTNLRKLNSLLNTTRYL
ncbi:hypothetical protein L596_026941 [Steinernema carpocapsae]|uniref:Uncharacterized protein n=1 Tax=Steinernema carpocapsae TaxID=34508 RepID=A0A4U5M2W7_STECR|nr:hypothetical protein L596_026941 [Steinernema carpocapsae]